MNQRKTLETRVQKLIDAFNEDGYAVNRETGIFYYDEIEPGSGKVGIAAEHKTATINGKKKKKKKVFYLEGTPRQMGFMLGYLAEPDVYRMSNKYVDNYMLASMQFVQKRWLQESAGWIKFLVGIVAAVWAAVRWVLSKIVPKYRLLEKIVKGLISTITGCVGSVIADILGHYANKNLQDIPEEYLDEMQGIYDGCKAVNPHTKVTFRDIVTLNVGVDVILAAMYTGLDLVKANPGLKPEHLKVPFMCNCFSVSKSAVEGDNHYMGRDFMFPAAGIFQETACMIIYKPDAEGALPIISVTAPGMVGSIAALNSSGVAVGVDISPSGWCNSKEPGFNSLLLSRQCIQYGADISKARDEIKKAKRGVSWIYILADGVNDRACIVETVMAADKDFDKEAPRSEMKKFDFTTGSTAKSSEESQRKAFLLWDKDDEAIRYIKDRYPGIGDSVIRNNGVKARWADEPYPASYLELNKKLFDIFDKTLEPGALEKEGFIDKYTPGTGIEKNTPFTFYFAPQREQNPDIVLATNHFVDPDMRYTVMNLWLGLMFADLTNDFQWRYDTLNSLLLEAVNNSENGITYDKAKELIDFLNPKGAYPWYYGKRAKVIQGSLSLMDLKAKTVESHYGYYSDEWIKLSLMKYL